MTTTMKDFGIDKLTPNQRVDLALEIWESLDDDRVVGQLNPELRAELARRDAEMDANPEIAITWEQIRSRVVGEK